MCRVRNSLDAGTSLNDKPRSGGPTKLKHGYLVRALKKKPTMTFSQYPKKKGVDRSMESKAVKKAGGKSLRKIDHPLLSKRH